MNGWMVLGWIGIADLGVISTMFAVAIGLVFIHSARTTDRRKSDYRENR